MGLSASSELEGKRLRIEERRNEIEERRLHQEKEMEERRLQMEERKMELEERKMQQDYEISVPERVYYGTVRPFHNGVITILFIFAYC